MQSAAGSAARPRSRNPRAHRPRSRTPNPAPTAGPPLHGCKPDAQGRYTASGRDRRGRGPRAHPARSAYGTSRTPPTRPQPTGRRPRGAAGGDARSPAETCCPYPRGARSMAIVCGLALRSRTSRSVNHACRDLASALIAGLRGGAAGARWRAPAVRARRANTNTSCRIDVPEVGRQRRQPRGGIAVGAAGIEQRAHREAELRAADGRDRDTAQPQARDGRGGQDREQPDGSDRDTAQPQARHGTGSQGAARSSSGNGSCSRVAELWSRRAPAPCRKRIDYRDGARCTPWLLLLGRPLSSFGFRHSSR
jgi:hypothetical protein